MQEQQSVQLQLTVEDVNVILNALGKAPYLEVYQLIGKIQQQASGQLREETEE